MIPVMTTGSRCSYVLGAETCPLPAVTRDPDLCALHDPDPQKDAKGFTGALRAKIRQDGEGAARRIIDLQGVVFPPEFSWLEATVGLDVQKPVNFERATFSGDAIFFEAAFSGDATFRRATFSGATFSGAAFFGATFSGAAIFRRAVLQGRLLFRGTGFPAMPPASLDFSDVHIERPEEVFFQHVDLSRVSFLRTDVTRVHFTDVTWPKREGHAVVFDHLRMETGAETPGESPSPRLVADIYRQIRLNLEGSRQEIEAGHFYIGQMDMRRRDPDMSRWYKAWLGVYRWTAMYGESWLRPLALYSLLAFAFAFLYMWGGFVWNEEVVQRNQFDLSSGFPLGDYIKAWYVAATAGALLRAGPIVIAPWLPIVQYINMLADILLLAVAVIALRRQFRR